MHVLHANWSADSGRLLVWGEDSAYPSCAPRRPGRRPKVARLRRHPFACSAEQARGAAAALAQSTDGEAREAVLLLPSGKDGPRSSPGLLRDEPAETVALAGLAPWSVPVLALTPEQALDLLLALPAGSPPGVATAEVAAGDSLRVLAEVAKLAIEVVTRGCVVPALEGRDDRRLARWLPFRLPDDIGGRLERLCRALPALGRAAIEPERFAAADKTARKEGWERLAMPPASALVDDLLPALVDRLVRDALSGERLAPVRRGRRPKALPAAEAWLGALATPDPAVAGAAAEDLERLAAELDTWFAAPMAGARGPFRTCFRLMPPGTDAVGSDHAAGNPANGDGESWQVEFLLQARDDPSLLVPADKVWRTRRGALTVLERRLDNPQEHLLGELGRAMSLYPALEEALRSARPAALALSTEGAWNFLRQGAPLLEQSGFGILAPAWWKKPGAGLGVKLKASSRREADGTSSARAGGGATTSSGLLGQDGLCAFEWSAALGGEELSQGELQRLAALKVPLVKTRGQWVEVRPHEIEQALAFLEQHAAGGEASTLELMRLGLGVEDSPAGLPVVGLEADGRLGELLAGEVRLRPRKTPRGFSGKLRPYQERGLAWLAFLGEQGLGACLADDMGLGKTIQVLALLVAERAGRGRKRASPGPTLLACPMSVLGNWQREAERFAPRLSVHLHHGPGRLAGGALAAEVAKTDLVITTYALVARDREQLAEIGWHRVVLDEAQNIKNPAARQTQAVRSLEAPQRLALTGTPVENRLSELWSIMHFLNPGLLGSARDFRKRFALPVERYRSEERATLLKRLCGPFILRRLKTDKKILPDLPEKLEIRVPCNLTREQATLYQAVVDEMMEKVEAADGIERKGLVLSTMLKLKQVCNHPAQLLQDRSSLAGRSLKLTRLVEILEEALAAGDRALVFTQFAEMGRMLRAHLQHRCGCEVLFLHGGTSRKQRDRMVERFQGAAGPPIFVLSIKAGGTGLNLTAASQVIHFDRWWNPAVEDQATDRAYRIGQTRNVQVRKLVCVGTLEERIDRMIEEKKALAERVVGTGESWLTELSTADLRNVVALSAEAVAEEAR